MIACTLGPSAFAWRERAEGDLGQGKPDSSSPFREMPAGKQTSCRLRIRSTARPSVKMNSAAKGFSTRPAWIKPEPACQDKIRRLERGVHGRMGEWASPA